MHFSNRIVSLIRNRVSVEYSQFESFPREDVIEKLAVSSLVTSAVSDTHLQSQRKSKNLLRNTNTTKFFFFILIKNL